MRKLSAFLLILILILSLCIPALAARPVIITPATGYQDADDVQYKTYSQSGKTVIANWGARGETCTFLSSYAEAYYTDSYTWDSMSQTSGGTTTSNTPSSALYRQLKTLMSSTHTFYTYYDGNKNVRDYYKYTDCVRNDTSKVSLFYFGTLLSSTWNGGTSWNQEHVWPKSKLSNSQQIGDIMHLRPADPTENSRRSNTAYGESGGYYDPGLGVRGDCARMMLYMYVRWGATSTMWGSSGVMENLTILLKWMEEDPVDTWEMGRNDSVQSITGTRNVFVDYPEYAWLLFGKEIPENMDTPSGNAGTKCRHQNTEVRGKTYADCTLSGYTGDTYCLDCGECIATGTTSPATGHLNTTTENQVDETCTTDGYTGDIYCYNCDEYISTGTTIPATGHLHTQRQNKTEPTCGKDGYTGDVYCYDCDEYISTGTSIPATGHLHTQRQNKTEPTCGKDGYTGDVYCLDCQQIIYTGITKPATGNHSFSEWLTRPGGGGKDRVCQVCGHIESQEDPASCAHVSKYTVTVQPTCTAKGHGGNYCEKCGEYLGGGKEIPATGHRHTEIRNKAAASCTSDGYTGDTWCTDCNTKIKTGQSIPAAGHKSTEIRDAKDANCTTDGYTGDTYCTDCGVKTAEGEVIPAAGHKNTEIRDAKDANCTTDGYTGDTYCTDCGVKTAEGEAIPAAGHKNTEVRDVKEANCTTDGYTGDTYCTDCGAKTAEGDVIPATGKHVYGPIAPGGQQTYQECTICGHRVVIDLEDDRPGIDWVVIGIAAAAIVFVGCGIGAIVIMKKKKR